jgi:hypothetical protein
MRRMNHFARLRSGPFRLLMAFALIAMAIRAVAPVGFMLSPDQDRWIVVTMCSGSGPMQMALNLDTGEHRDGAAPAHNNEGADVHSAPCVFAAAATLAPPDAAVDAAPLHVAFANSVPVLSPLVGIGRGLAAPPPWATGPPTHL